MIRRTILHQSKRAISNIPQRHSPSSPFVQASFRPTTPSPLPPRRIASSSFYSTNTEPTASSSQGEASAAEDIQAERKDESSSQQQQSQQPQQQQQPAPKKEEDPLRQELESKNQEIINLKDKYLRSVADFRNLQERTRREVESARAFAIQRFAKDLIDSVDNLDRALNTVPPEKLDPNDNNNDNNNDTDDNSDNADATSTTRSSSIRKDLINLYDGLKMTETILMQTLKKHGLERFDPSVNEEKFDPNLHEATFQTPVDGKEDGTVFMTQQKGFVLNGRVLRAAKVGLVKNS